MFHNENKIEYIKIYNIKFLTNNNLSYNIKDEIYIFFFIIPIIDDHFLYMERKDGNKNVNTCE